MIKLIFVSLVIVSIYSFKFEVFQEMQDIFVQKIQEMKQKAEEKQYSDNLMKKPTLKIDNGNNYYLCYIQLEKTIGTFAELTELVVKKDIIDIIPKSLKLTANIVDSIDCFQHPPNKLNDSRAECVIGELKKFLLVLKQMLRDIYEKKFDKASVDLQKAVEILKGIKEVCPKIDQIDLFKY